MCASNEFEGSGVFVPEGGGLDAEYLSIWVSENLSQSYTKIGPFTYFLFLKKRFYHIPGGAEKGGYSARKSVICHI